MIIFCVNTAGQDSLAIADTLSPSIDDSLKVEVQNDSTIIEKVEVKRNNVRIKRRLVFSKVKCSGKSFLIASPEGWVLDEESGKDQGLEVVFYPQGWNLDYAPALIYTKIISKNGDLDKSFTDVISEQVDQLKNYGAVILKDSIAYTYDNKQSVIINFIDKSTQTNNLVSYINEYNYVVSMILTSQDKDQFLKSKPKFFELINSYKIN
jgi:hypothetical protein